jgi:hypothetical protein
MISVYILFRTIAFLKKNIGMGFQNDYLIYETFLPFLVSILNPFCKLCLCRKNNSHSPQRREFSCRRSLERVKMPFEISHFVETKFLLRKDRSMHSIYLLFLWTNVTYTRSYSQSDVLSERTYSCMLD